MRRTSKCFRRKCDLYPLEPNRAILLPKEDKTGILDFAPQQEEGFSNGWKAAPTARGYSSNHWKNILKTGRAGNAIGVINSNVWNFFAFPAFSRG